MRSLTVLNADTARFDCTFGRGCDGKCCRNGRPSVTPEERRRIDAVLPKVSPLLRPAAAKAVARGGWLSKRTKFGRPMVRAVGKARFGTVRSTFR